MNKIKIVIVSLFILLALLFSFSKATFLFELTQSSLMPKAHQEKKIKILAQAFFKNGRLSPLIKERYPNDEMFFAFFAMELIKNANNLELKKQANFLFPIMLEMFPENIFLKDLNFYPRNAGSKDWENFDFLFFGVLRATKFNRITKKTIIQSISDQRISRENLSLLILYLSWMKNYSLAEDLLIWGSKENRLDKNSSNLLQENIHLRKNKNNFQGAQFLLDKPRIENMLKKLINNNDIKIDSAQNLISDGSFIDQNSLKKYWDFSDMSDSEPFSKGSFYGDFDSMSEKSMRVMGFFTKQIANKEGSRAGFWYKEEIPLAEKVYLFYFRYKTFQGKEIPTFWLSYTFKKEWGLEPTDFKWSEVYYIFDNRQFKIQNIRPLLRMFGTGTVWFDDVCLLEIEPGGISIEKEILFIK